MVHRLAVVLLAFALGGCSSGAPASPETSSGAATPEPSAHASDDAVPHYTLAQLRAALPGLEDVPGGSRRTAKCPDPSQAKACAIDNGTVVSVDFELKRSSTGSAAADEAGANTSVLGDLAFVSVTVFETATAKRQAVAGFEQRQSDSDGDFATQAVPQGSSSYTFGTRGSGSKRSVALDDWRGSRIDRAFALVDLEGDVGERRVDAQQYVSLGRMILSVDVTLEATSHTRSDASDLTGRLASDYLARLGAATTD